MKNYLNLENDKDYKKLKEPAKIIKNGGIVVFPTETVYGIGTNGLDGNAVKNLYRVKKRPTSNPISLLVANIEMIEMVAKDITKEEYEIIKKFMPGPLTIILKKKDIVPDILTANLDTVGVRMPENDIALNLIKYVGSPIATSSANISGKQSGTNIQNIIKEFRDNVDYYIDGGDSKIGKASTIVRIENGRPHILRYGSISEEQIIHEMMVSYYSQSVD